MINFKFQMLNDFNLFDNSVTIRIRRIFNFDQLKKDL